MSKLYLYSSQKYLTYTYVGKLTTTADKLSGEGLDRVFIQHSLKIYQFTVLTRDFVSKEGGVDARGAEFAARLFKSLQVLSNAALSMAAMAIK